jgi:hypothetical protein
LPNSMTFSVFMTISFDDANLVRPLLFAKATPNLGARVANAISDACFFVQSMSIKKVMLEWWRHFGARFRDSGLER